MSVPVPGVNIGVAVAEDGSMIRGVHPGTPFTSIADARAHIERMPTGPQRQQAEAKLAEVENEAARVVWTHTLKHAEDMSTKIATAQAKITQHIDDVRGLLTRVRAGTVSAAEASQKHDEIVRYGMKLEPTIASWTRQIEEAERDYSNPAAASDELRKRLPVLNAGRPVITL